MDTLSKILIIDDSVQDRMILEAILSESFDIVDTCQSMREGLRFAKASEPDLILLDLNLPDTTGVETFRTVHKCFPNRVVVLSGIDDIQLALTTLEEGALDYIAKFEILHTRIADQIRKCIVRKKWMTRALQCNPLTRDYLTQEYQTESYTPPTPCIKDALVNSLDALNTASKKLQDFTSDPSGSIAQDSQITEVLDIIQRIRSQLQEETEKIEKVA